jgi:hypothetical protein
MVRRTIVALAVTGALLAAFGGQAVAVPVHLHCLTTASGDVHSLGMGVTLNAPHDSAFHNLHGQVHLGAFASHPLGTLSADFTAPYTCPPSP